jgi:uncharacterized membrane protein (UPF0182 family)
VLNLLRQGETVVNNGNLLTLPVGGGLLYVQPVYVKSSTGTQFPLLQKVFVSFGDEVGFADTLAEALDQVFGEGAAPDVPDAPEVPGTPDTPDTPETPDTPDTPGALESPEIGDARDDLKAALNDANTALKDGQEALRNNDFAAYGEAQERLQKALERAIEAETRLEEALQA